MDLVSDALRSSCMRARIYTTAFGRTVTVRDASRKVEQDNGAVSGAARVVANKLAGADEYDKAVRAAQKFCTDALAAVSMPYGKDDGWRLLPTNVFLAGDLARKLGEGQRLFQAALADYETHADAILQRARANLGALDVDLPTKDQLIGAYTIRSSFEELPSGNIPGLPDSTNQVLKRRVEKQLADVAAEAKDYTLRRFVQPLEHFVEAMQRYDEREAAVAAVPKGEKPGRLPGFFRDTVVTNIRELYETLESFNILGDADIAELGNMVASLATQDPDTLRSSETVRSAARTRATQVLDHLQGWLNPVAQAAE